MRYDDHGLISVFLQDGVYSFVKTRMGLIRCFSSKHKLIGLLKELADRTLKGIMRKKWHLAPVMFVQPGENLHRQSQVIAQDISCLLCLRLVAGDEYFRRKVFQLLRQPLGA